MIAKVLFKHRDIRPRHSLINQQSGGFNQIMKSEISAPGIELHLPCPGH
jgi:hypothetical protein